MAAERGAPISYRVLKEGTPVLSSEGERVGTVAHVLADAGKDIFEGVVVSTSRLPGVGHRFADATHVRAIHEHAVLLDLGADEVDRLRGPGRNPSAVGIGPDDLADDRLADRLRRAWNWLSGRY